MKVTPDDYGRRCQFDHFCKLVLYHEAVDYFRERKRQRGLETSFETLPLSELDTLCTIDQYPSDSFIFPAYRPVLSSSFLLCKHPLLILNLHSVNLFCQKFGRDFSSYYNIAFCLQFFVVFSHQTICISF